MRVHRPFHAVAWTLMIIQLTLRDGLHTDLPLKKPTPLSGIGCDPLSFLIAFSIRFSEREGRVLTGAARRCRELAGQLRRIGVIKRTVVR
jgi:hypothetical protein